MRDLHAEILAAHDRRDLHQLAELYEAAADQANSTDAECFFLTHAYIFALDAGSPRAEALHERLKAQGREE